MTKIEDDRFAPISNADWPPEITEMVGGFAGGLNVYRTMAHHPALLKAWADLREHVVNKTSLGAQRSEVVILRTGTRLSSSYEWHQHIVRARQCGMDDRRIASIAGPLSGMDQNDALLANAVDELFSEKRISVETQNSLLPHLGKVGILDLIATVGFYSTLGYILNSFETPLDENIKATLATNPFNS